MEEEEIERKVWNKCSLCEEEYKENEIRMNEECLHSYCLECIEQSASTSLLCPICHSQLPSPISSSLPLNYTLIHWQTLSPPLSSPSLLSLSNNIDKDDNKEELTNLCEDCEENKAEIHCSDCKSFLCSSCSNDIHSRKSTRNHTLSPITNSTAKKVSGALPVSSPILNFYCCKEHNQRTMELYCMKCNECVCIDCMRGLHMNHPNTHVLNRVEDIKEEWKKAVEEISTEFLNNHLQSADKQSKDLSNNIDQINDEIKTLEEKLNNLKEKKETLIAHMKSINESKEKIHQTYRYLLSFLQSLPSLPLSSFLPSPPNNVDDNINNNKDKDEKKGRRIKEFFEKENLFSLFSSLLPSSSPNIIVDPLSHFTLVKGRKYSVEEKEKRNEMIRSNQLILNHNLLSHFGSKGSKDHQFNFPYYISYNDKVNMMAISDYNNNRVKIVDKKGSFLRSFPVQYPYGIVIIPSLHLLAVSSRGKHVIEMFDLSPLLLPSNDFINNNNNNKEKKSIIDEEGKPTTAYEPLPLLYTIGKGRGGTEDHFHFNEPHGIAYSEGKGRGIYSEGKGKEEAFLAVSDNRNKRIEIYRIRRDGYDHHSFIPNLPFNPNHIAISSPADLILLPRGGGVWMYKEEEGEEKGGKMKWRCEGEIRSPPSLLPPLSNAEGVAIHSPLNYFVICDVNHHRVLFFNITTRDLICSFQPILPPPSPSSSFYFKTPWGISIDEEADLISVSGIGSHSISLFLSPIF